MRKELYHIRGFKYIKKIPVGSGFRYFYSMDEIRAYYDKSKHVLDDTRSSRSRQFKHLPSHNSKIKQNIKTTGRRAEPSTGPRLDDLKKKLLTKRGQKLLDKLLKRDKDKKKSEIKKETKYKYTQKIQVNGQTRYFYSDAEYQTYLKRKEYYKNEPEFMKSFKKSKDPYTAEEDAILVNPKYNSRNTDYQYNCAECTAIYELRRRGYDVESNGVSGQPNSNIWWKKALENVDAYRYNTEWRYKEFYKDAKIVRVPEGDTHNSSADNVRKAIEKNPPGSRGDISVAWKDGGAHSMVWEVDSKGKARIYDAQVSGRGSRAEYNLDDLMSKTTTYKSKGNNAAIIVRTDNLELNKGITKICKNSSDKKKGVSVEKDRHRFTSSSHYVKTEKWTDKELETKYPILSKEERRT